MVDFWTTESGASSVQKAKYLQQQGKLSEAREHAKTAIKRCPCYAQQARNKRLHACNSSDAHKDVCLIAQTQDAVHSNDSATFYKIARGPCRCGRQFFSCTNATHQQAMECLIDCSEAAKSDMSAAVNIMILIRMNPAFPMGYCRMLKFLRARPDLDLAALGRDQVSSKGPRPSTQRKVRRELHQWVKVGFDLVKTHGTWASGKHNDILQQIVLKLGLIIPRHDPLSKLPFEIICMIFGRLDTYDLFRCLRVSKSWNKRLEKDSSIWSTLLLHRPKKISHDQWRSFLQKRSRIRSLVVRDLSRFGMTERKLSEMLAQLPNLENLGLAWLNPPSKNYGELIASGEDRFVAERESRLTRLAFKNEQGLGTACDTLRNLLSYTRMSLEELYITSLVGFQGGPVFSQMELPLVLNRLKYLKIEGNVESLDSGDVVAPMGDIILSTPNLEQFHADHVALSWGSRVAVLDQSLWRKLSVFVLGQETVFDGPKCLPALGETIRVIDLATRVKWSTFYGLRPRRKTLDSGEIGEVSWSKLEHFRSSGRLRSKEALRRAIEPALRSGCLRVLDITLDCGASPRDQHDPGDYNGWTTHPARDLPFTMGDGVQILGLHDFHWESPSAYSPGLNPQPFLDWLDGFPAVHTVIVYPNRQRGAGSLLAALVRRAQIKTVVFDPFIKSPGAPGYDPIFPEVDELAKKRGVNLLPRPEYSPTQFPWLF